MKKTFFAALMISLLVFSAAGAALAKDTLVVADQYDATTMDPIAHNDVPSSRACYSIYDTLIFIDNEGKTLPGLATSWEFLSDTEYKFNLRKGVKFHNGEEMKAADVKYSIERATTDLGAQIRTYSQNVKGVKVVDDYTVVISLKSPDYSFFSSLCHSWASILNKKATEAAGANYGMNPVGTGPFKFVSWQKGNKYTLARFDGYWGPKVKFKTLEVRSIPEPTSRTIELESGGTDVAFPIVTNEIKRVEGNSKLALVRKPQTSVTYMGFNMTKAPFTDARVRRAIYDAIDVVAVQKAVWRGVGNVPTSLVPGSVKYSIAKEVPAHKRNVENAKKLLAEAGVKNLKLNIWTNERKERVDMATIIQAQLQEVGITSQIRVLEWGAYLNGLQQKQHDLFLLGWVSSIPDPNFAVSGLLEGSAGSNYTFTADSKLDKFLDQGRRTPDGPARAKIYKDMQLYINELLPMIYLHGDESIAGMQKNVKGVDIRSNEIHSFRGAYFE